MALFARRPRLDAAALESLRLRRQERVLAFQEMSGPTVVATDHRLCVIEGGPLLFERPWHAVDTMTWDADSSTLRVRWMDDTPPWSVVVEHPDADLMTTLRARVQSTLVASAAESVGGRTVRVILRKDLRSDELFFQHQYGRSARSAPSGTADVVARLEAGLRDDAGLPPTWTGAEPDHAS